MRYCTICDTRITERAYKKHCDKHELNRIANMVSATMRTAQNYTAYVPDKVDPSEDALMTESEVLPVVDNATDDQSNDEDESCEAVEAEEEAAIDQDQDDQEEEKVNEIEQVNLHLERHLENTDRPLKIDFSSTSGSQNAFDKLNIELKMFMRENKVNNVAQDGLIKHFNKFLRSIGYCTYLIS
ncbi:hypothetical protein A0J61_11426, partial [Choanephora cucurbitarum]